MHFLWDIILQTPKICVGKITHFDSIPSKAVVISIYAFLKAIENSTNWLVASWGLSLVLNYSHLLVFAQLALVLSSGPLVLHVL